MLDENTNVPDELNHIQYIRADSENQKEELIDSIDSQIKAMGVADTRLQGEAQLRWNFVRYKDSWDGIPGYDTEFRLIRFSSDTYRAASEITEVIKGWLFGEQMRSRAVKFDQDPTLHHFGDEKFLRQNTWDAECEVPRVKGRIVSVIYRIWWYGAGAAHPNLYFKTFTFCLDPLMMIWSIKEIFDDEVEALIQIQEYVRDKLIISRSRDDTGEDVAEFDADWLAEGTKDWTNFENYSFSDEGIEFLFAPYQIASYAQGEHAVVVPYVRVVGFLKRHYASLLGVEHLWRSARSGDA